MAKRSKIVGRDIPLLFACSGASAPGELADLIARRLNKSPDIVMTCPTAVTAGFQDFTRKLKADRKVIVLDGCRKSCVARTLCNEGYDGFLHIRLDKLGLRGKKLEADEETVARALDKVRGVFKAKAIWKEHRFHHLTDLNKLK